LRATEKKFHVGQKIVPKMEKWQNKWKKWKKNFQNIIFQLSFSSFPCHVTNLSTAIPSLGILRLRALALRGRGGHVVLKICQFVEGGSNISPSSFIIIRNQKPETRPVVLNSCMFRGG
jgi:hypothetical protein